MENNLKLLWNLSLGLLFFLTSCTSSDSQEKESKPNQVSTEKVMNTYENKIIYTLDSNIVQFIEDSIMFKSFKVEIKTCVISCCDEATKIEFSYKDDNINPEGDFIIANSNRFLKINKTLIPVFFKSDTYFADFSFVDKSKTNLKTTNWFNYAILKFNTNNEIVEYRNFYKELLNKKDKK